MPDTQAHSKLCWPMGNLVSSLWPFHTMCMCPPYSPPVIYIYIYIYIYAFWILNPNPTKLFLLQQNSPLQWEMNENGEWKDKGPVSCPVLNSHEGLMSCLYYQSVFSISFFLVVILSAFSLPDVIQPYTARSVLVTLVPRPVASLTLIILFSEMLKFSTLKKKKRNIQTFWNLIL
jgi:hypothetical protein